jgi:protein SCO1/2
MGELPVLSPRVKILLFVASAVLISGALAFKIFQPITVLPRLELGPGLMLTNQLGERVTSEDLRGKIVLINFTYTHCQEPDCFQTTDDMQRVRERLAGVDLAGLPVALVTISFDPERDTPRVMQQFAAQFGAASPGDLENDDVTWNFLTGDPDNPDLLKVIVGGGFNTFYEREGDEFRFQPRYVLMDGWGIIRAVDEVLGHVELIAKEARGTGGVLGLAYGAAHLFRCYPG